MFIIFFLFLVSAFYFFFNFDFLTICHPSPVTHHPLPATRGKVQPSKTSGKWAILFHRLNTVSLHMV